MRGKKNTRLIVLFATLFVLILVYFHQRYKVIRITGNSMVPTIQSGEWWIMDTQAEPRKNDIVAVNVYPQEPLFVKRVSWDSTDKYVLCIVDFDDTGNDIYQFEDKTARVPKTAPFFRLFLRPQDFIVLGDNLEDSEDSREFGPIDRNQIEGVLFQKI